jgi:hypothetical protein
MTSVSGAPWLPCPAWPTWRCPPWRVRGGRGGGVLWGREGLCVWVGGGGEGVVYGCMGGWVGGSRRTVWGVACVSERDSRMQGAGRRCATAKGRAPPPWLPYGSWTAAAGVAHRRRLCHLALTHLVITRPRPPPTPTLPRPPTHSPTHPPPPPRPACQTAGRSSSAAACRPA